MARLEEDIVDLAAIQAADNLSPFQVRITWEQGEDGLPHASAVEAERQR